MERYLSLFLALVGVLTIVLMYISAQRIKDKNEIEKNQLLEVFIPILDVIFEDFRKVNHDYRNHYATLSMMKSHPDMYSNEDVQTYLTEMNDQFDWQAISQIQSSILMVLIFSYRMKFDEVGIELEVDQSLHHERAFDRKYEVLLVLVNVLNRLLESLKDNKEAHVSDIPNGRLIISSEIKEKLCKLTIIVEFTSFEFPYYKTNQFKKEMTHHLNCDLFVRKNDHAQIEISIVQETYF